MSFRQLDEMTAMDPDFGNEECLNQVVTEGTSRGIVKYVLVCQALLMPIVFCYRVKAREASKVGSDTEFSLRKKSYLALGAVTVAMIIAAMSMETTAQQKSKGPFPYMFSINTAYLWYLFLLAIYIGVKDFGARVEMISRCVGSVPRRPWATQFLEMCVLGIGGVWLPLMGSWTLYRCYDVVDSIGHLIPSGSYFVWSGVMMCFMGVSKTHSGKLRLLLAESYMWGIFATIFIIYYSWQARGGMFYSYFHSGTHTLWVGDQQHTMVSLCWLASAVLSRMNVSYGYANSFHYLVLAPPVVMTMFDHPKACHRTMLAHKMHGLLLLGSLFFRAFDQIHQASVLMFLAGLSFISATQCLIVWSINNQVVELYVFTIVGGGLMFWSYALYILKDLVFDPEDLDTDLSGENEKIQYSQLSNPAQDDLWEAVDKNGTSAAPEAAVSQV